MAHQESELSVEAVAALADQLAQASAHILAFRVLTKGLKKEQRAELERLETTLDQLVAILRGKAIRLIGEQAQGELGGLLKALAEAQRTLAKIARIKHAINMAAAFVNVAAALVGGNVPAILAAAKGLAAVAEKADQEPAEAATS